MNQNYRMLYWKTVDGLLKNSLILVMQTPEFLQFRLVGGTALSLQLGHRMSVDIDLFTDALYGSIDFAAIDSFLNDKFSFVRTSLNSPAMGKCYILGNSKEEVVRLDVFYTDDFIRPSLSIDGIRMAALEDIAAMKIEVISRGGRKKDFWDVHQLLDTYTVEQMLALHEERYPYGHNEAEIRANFKNFTQADDEFDPLCLHGKHWELIKQDILEALDR